MANTPSSRSGAYPPCQRAGRHGVRLKSFFKILQQQHVPPEDLDSTLRKIAASYRQLQAQPSFTSEDPEVMGLRQQAKQVLETGDFTQVETLLRQAHARDLRAIQEQEGLLKKRQFSAAATSAELGELRISSYPMPQPQHISGKQRQSYQWMKPSHRQST